MRPSRSRRKMRYTPARTDRNADQPCSIGVNRAVTVAMSRLLPCQHHARIEERLDQVDDEVHDHVEEGDHDRRTEDCRVVERDRGLERVLSDAVPYENLLDEEGPRQLVRDGQTEGNDRGGDRVLEGQS